MQNGNRIFANNSNIKDLAFAGYAIKSGLACTGGGAGVMNVVVAAGYFYVAGVLCYYAGGSVVIAAADATYPRKDIISISSAGVLTATAGSPVAATPVGSTGPDTITPIPPDIPTDETTLCELWVAAGVTGILTANITSIGITAASYGAFDYGMSFQGTVSGVVGSPTEVQCSDLIGYGDDYFKGYWIYVVWDAAAAGAAPQGEKKLVTSYTSLTGNFVFGAFTVPLAATDKILVMHPAIMVDDYIDSEVTAIKAKTDYLQSLEDAAYFKTGGTDGTTWPTGTAQDPSGDMTDVLTMCASRNTTRIIMTTGTTLIESCEGYTFIGVNQGITIDLGSQDVDGSHFYNCTLTGIQGGTGYIYTHDCIVDTVTGFAAYCIGGSVIGTITPRSSARCVLVDVGTGEGATEIDFASKTSVALFLRSLNGGISAKNSTDNNNYMSVSSGGAIFRSAITNTNGTFKARGETLFTKGGGGAIEVDYTIYAQMGVYSGDGGAAADDSVKAQLDIVQTDVAAAHAHAAGAETAATTAAGHNNPDAAGTAAGIINTTDKLNLLLAATDGAASTLAAANVADGSIIAKLASKAANGATPEAFNCTTDSLEALSDKIGAFTGDGGADQGDSIKADLDLINDLVDGIEAKTNLILPGTKFATKTSTSHLTSGDLFTYTGSIGIVSIIGRVTTALEAATAQTIKLTCTPDALSATDLCATKDANAFAVGSLLTITGTLADAMIGATGVGCAVSQASMITATCVTDGHISVVFGTADKDGVIVWELFWTPLTPGATCVAA